MNIHPENTEERVIILGRIWEDSKQNMTGEQSFEISVSQADKGVSEKVLKAEDRAKAWRPVLFNMARVTLSL